MKVCTIQPPYSMDANRMEELFAWELRALQQCDDSMDLIVLPESCDVPCYAKTREAYMAAVEKHTDRFLAAAAETAKRCHAVLFCNANDRKTNRNTTFAFDRNGVLCGKYDKRHLVASEVTERKLDSGYTYTYTPRTFLEIDGVKYAFLTCYDFYFYEAFADIARHGVDVIIGCSHQRSDRQDAIALITRFCAYNCNAHVVRASVSMGEDTEIGGSSMIVSPDGRMICDMKSRTGMETAVIDTEQKYYKPAGFGNPPAAHYEYIERGRRPWQYRPAGSAIVCSDAVMPYPRVCAHRGFSTVAPENSMPAFGAAVALGAQEIEFDVWYTSDGELVSIHDGELERVSTGTGNVFDHTLAELLEYDFGVKFGESYAGLKILTVEEILRKFSRHTIMNIHIKTRNNTCAYDEALLDKLLALIDQYDCREHVYFMTGNCTLLGQLQQKAPDICRCCGAGDHPWEIVDSAIQYGCKKVQLFKPYFNQEMIDKAHQNGILCNVFWSDDPKETEAFLEMGIDTILTNDYYQIAQTVAAKYK